MKRTWIGGGILAVLLAVGLLAGTLMDKQVSPWAEKLRLAAAAALDEDWDTALTLTADVQSHWDRVKAAAEILTTHEDLEQIEISFAQLSAYASKDGPEFSAICTALARQLEALGKAHGCSVENLF